MTACETARRGCWTHLCFVEIVYRFVGSRSGAASIASAHTVIPIVVSPLRPFLCRSCAVLVPFLSFLSVCGVQRSHLCSENNYSELSTLCHVRVVCAYTRWKLSRIRSSPSRILSGSICLARTRGPCQNIDVAGKNYYYWSLVASRSYDAFGVVELFFREFNKAREYSFPFLSRQVKFHLMLHVAKREKEMFKMLRKISHVTRVSMS